MILLIDNYDSFSYNLYQLIGEINPDIRVVRNDELTVDEIDRLSPEAIVISPGPGRPENAGVSIEVIKKLSGKIPILGVCLGHQAICEAFGAVVGYAKKLTHGKASIAWLAEDKLFDNVGIKTEVARYHSLAAEANTMPECLEIIAKTDDEEIMAVKHKEHKTYGLQFHPESILTPKGRVMLENFFKMA
ncbi:MAG: aminodeoxychorismate/anthranilate synthase component II [Lachnospiraceae bacterium]|nr:aminodeoxychorismate/anthranilate synthase component II [Lachnospiraceae bacterium]